MHLFMSFPNLVIYFVSKYLAQYGNSKGININMFFELGLDNQINQITHIKNVLPKFNHIRIFLINKLCEFTYIWIPPATLISNVDI